MKKKSVVIFSVLILVVAVVSVYFLTVHQDDKSDEEIRKMFNCDRITADVRATDVYCKDQNVYREHLLQNKVIKPTDPLE